MVQTCLANQASKGHDICQWCTGTSNARRTFHAVTSQLGSPAKPHVLDLASAAIRNASRSVVPHQAPLQLKHWPHLPRVHAFQASLQLVNVIIATQCC